jgi:hypothetical protein
LAAADLLQVLKVQRAAVLVGIFVKQLFQQLELLPEVGTGQGTLQQRREGCDMCAATQAASIYIID